MTAFFAAVGVCWLVWRPMTRLIALAVTAVAPEAERATGRRPSELARVLVDEARDSLTDIDIDSDPEASP